MGLTVHRATAQSYDFDNGNDSGWTRYDPISESGLGGVATWTFPNGNSYRIQTAPSPLPGTVGPGRAGSVVTEFTYASFYISVDIVNWDPTLDQAIGVMGRVSEIGLGTTDGYAMTYSVLDGNIDITRFTNEDPNGGGLSVTGNNAFSLVSGRAYRFVFIGWGTQFTARVYELPDLTTPVADITGFDTMYSTGYSGLITYDNTSAGNGRTDVTYDNFMALDIEPPKLAISLSVFSDLEISWTTNSYGFILQGAPAIDSPTWTDLAPPYTQVGDQFVYARDDIANQPMKYYRLRRPPD
jgi:hypothetical protein